MNNFLEYKGYSGTVEYSAADNILFGSVLGLKGLISYEGSSVQSLKEDFEGAIDDYLDMCKEEKVTPEKPYDGRFSIQIPSDLHKNIDLYSISHGMSFDSAVEKALEDFLR
jgi:predicted HicB family RNase H-like nuclease